MEQSRIEESVSVSPSSVDISVFLVFHFGLISFSSPLSILQLSCLPLLEQQASRWDGKMDD